MTCSGAGIRPIFVAWAQGLAAVFTVVLLFALLPVVGVAGAAIASTVAYGVALAAMLRSPVAAAATQTTSGRRMPIASEPIDPEP